MYFVGGSSVYQCLSSGRDPIIQIQYYRCGLTSDESQFSSVSLPIMLIMQFRMMWAVFTARHAASSPLQASTLPQPTSVPGKGAGSSCSPRPGELHPPSGVHLSETSDGLGVLAPVGDVIHMETKSIPSYQVRVMALGIFCLPISSPLPPNL